jgi:hypothetical protein
MASEPETIVYNGEPPTIRGTALLLAHLLFKWAKTEGRKFSLWFGRLMILMIISGTSTGTWFVHMLSTGIVSKWEQARGYFIHPSRNTI